MKSPGIVIQKTANNDEQCVVFYSTHQGNQTVMQIAELELDKDGKVVCNRNQYAPPATATSTLPSTGGVRSHE